MTRALDLLRRIEWGHPDSAFMQKHRPGYWRECPCCRAEVTDELAKTAPIVRHADRHRPGCELAAELDIDRERRTKQAAIDAALDRFVDYSAEALKNPSPKAEKRKRRAEIAYERAAGVPCRGCGKPDCARAHNDEGELLCDPNTIPEEP